MLSHLVKQTAREKAGRGGEKSRSGHELRASGRGGESSGWGGMYTNEIIRGAESLKVKEIKRQYGHAQRQREEEEHRVLLNPPKGIGKKQKQSQNALNKKVNRKKRTIELDKELGYSGGQGGAVNANCGRAARVLHKKKMA